MTDDGDPALNPRLAAEQAWKEVKRRQNEYTFPHRPLPNGKGEAIPAAPANRINHQPTPIRATPYVWVEPAALPRRRWLYGRHLIRGFVSTTIGTGGRGKTSLLVAEALAMVTGRPLLGDQPAGRLRVWLISMEDPLEELQRRIAAGCLRYKITKEDLGDRLFLDAGQAASIVIARDQRNGVEIIEPVVGELKAELKSSGIDVLMIDPFVDSHAVAENDNAKISAVMRTWAEIASDTDSGIELAHHVRKPANPNDTLTVEDGRGASTQVYKARDARVLNTMTEKQAQAAKVDNRRYYFSVVSGKANLIPPPEKATWRRLVGFSLGNGISPADPGDEIGVVEAWEFPDVFEGVKVEQAKEVQRRIADGQWRSNSQANNWAGRAVAEVLDLDLEDKDVRGRIRKMLAEWCESGALKEVERPDEHRNIRKFIEVGQWIK